MNLKKLLMVPGAAAVGALALVTGGGAALADGPVNPSFETGDTTGWTEFIDENGAIRVESGLGVPGTGTYTASVFGGNINVSTLLSQTVNLAVGETISGWVKFDYNDNCPYNDTGSVVIEAPGGDSTLFSRQGCADGGSVDWVKWSYTASQAGPHTIVGESTNRGDDAVASALLMDAELEFAGFTRAWLFGDCESEDCRGFGMIFGNLGGEDDLRNAILVALGDYDLYGPFVLRAYAFKVGAQFVPPIMFSTDGESCEPPPDPVVVGASQSVLTADQSAGSGLWLTWFDVGLPCGEPPKLQAGPSSR